jgi:hypothetical protein
VTSQSPQVFLPPFALLSLPTAIFGAGTSTSFSPITFGTPISQPCRYVISFPSFFFLDEFIFPESLSLLYFFFFYLISAGHLMSIALGWMVLGASRQISRVGLSSSPSIW